MRIILKDSSTLCPIGGLPEALRTFPVKIRLTRKEESMVVTLVGGNSYQAWPARGSNLHHLLAGISKAQQEEVTLEVVE